MGYMLIINTQDKKIEIHSDLCDEVFEKKENFELNNILEYIPFNYFSEVEEYLNRSGDYETVFCEICRPDENKDVLDEDYDDFYEEFDEDDETASGSCDII